MRVSLVIFLLLPSAVLLGQSNALKQHGLFLEIAGSGGLGSINYESIFYQSDLVGVSLRSGFSIAPIDRNNGTGLVFPVMINTLLGRNNHRLEAGIGQGITITTKGSFYTLTTMAVGYRFQRSGSQWFYRISYTPLLSYLLDIQYQHWAGLSIGYTLPDK